MFCFIYKWLISRALDTGKGLSAAVHGHLHHCPNCRDFARLSEVLSRRLVQDAAALLQEKRETLDERVTAALARKPKPSLPGRRTLVPLPAFATVLVVLAAAVGLILLTFSPAAKDNPIESLSEFRLSGTSLPAIVSRVESPIEAEMHELRQSVKSAADFLVSCLDIEIGRSTR